MYRNLGFTVAAGAAAGSAAGPVGTVIGTAAGLLASVLPALLGGGRGDYQKFDREMRPTLLRQAQKTGLLTVCLWFGEVVGVDSANNRFVLGPATGANSGRDEGARTIQAAADSTGQAIYAFWDGVFKLFQPGSQPPVEIQTPISAAGFIGTGANALPFLIGGTALLFFFRKGRK